MRTLSGRLVDEISEALLRPRQPEERSEAVVAIVEEIYENVRWLHGSTQNAEIASLHQLVTAARVHSEQMKAPDGGQPRVDHDQLRVGSGASSPT